MGGAGQPFGMGRATVLVDLYPLFSPSAFQGIGRYLRALLQAFQRLAATQAFPFSLAGLDTRTPHWQVIPLQDLGDLLNRPPELLCDTPNSWERRFAWHQLKRLGCHCLHQAEPRQVPITGPIPLVLTYHDLIPLELPRLYSRKAPRLRQALNWLITRWRLFLATHVLTDSQYVARRLTSLFGFPEEKITVAYIGVDLKRYCPEPLPEEKEILRGQLGLEEGYWLFVGTGDPRKNLEFLLKAVAKAQSSAPVVLAGRVDPRQEPLVRKAIAASGLGNQVRRLGFVDEAYLPSLYRGSLGLLFPSLSEGFGLPLLEAMACGKPALAFNATALPEVAGEDGAWLLPPGDLEAFAEAIKALEQTPEKRRRLGQKGRARAQRFTWEATAQIIGQVYSRLLRAPKS